LDIGFDKVPPLISVSYDVLNGLICGT